MLTLADKSRQYEKGARTYAEIVPWLMKVMDNLVVCKDGALLASFEVNGKDIDGIEQDDSDRMAEMLQRAFKVFHDKPISIWWTVTRTKTHEYPQASFPDDISRYIDEKWREQFSAGANYTNSHYLTIVMTPPNASDQLIDQVRMLAASGQSSIASAAITALRTRFFDEYAFPYAADELHKQIFAFNEMLAGMLEASRELKIKRLEGGSLDRFLHDVCSPPNAGQPVKPVSGFLDGSLPDSYLTVGKQHLRWDSGSQLYGAALSIKEFPGASRPGMLDALLSIPADLTISQVFRFADRDSSSKYISGVRRFNDILKHSWKAYVSGAFKGGDMSSANVDKGRMRASEDADNALGNLTTGQETFGWFNMTLVAYAASVDAVESSIGDASATLQSAGYLPVRENIGLLSAWSGTLPGQWSEIVRWFFVSSANFADFSPIRTISRGVQSNAYLSGQTGRACPALSVVPTDYATPYYLNLHVGDLGHVFVVGPAGSGKSTCINFFLSQFRKYSPVRIYIFDKDNSCKIATLMQGGQHINPSRSDSGIQTNPCLLLADKEAWEWLSQWIELLITSHGYVMNADDGKSIWHAIEGATADSDPTMWRLLTIYTLLPRHLQTELAPWVGNGPLARYFDNQEDTFTLGDFTCMEMGEILENPRVARAFTDYAFYRIHKEINYSGDQVIPTIIYIEEAWFMLEEPRFAAKIRDWLKTLRKKTAQVILTTQSIGDLAESDIFQTISDNIPTRIFLPNDRAGTFRGMYHRLFGLNDTQIDRIRTAIPKHNYYLVQPGMSRMLNMSLPPEILACVRSDKRAQLAFEKWRQSGRIDWMGSYIKEMTGA